MCQAVNKINIYQGMNRSDMLNMMVKILIKQQGSISDWFDRLEKEEAGCHEGSEWIE